MKKLSIVAGANVIALFFFVIICYAQGNLIYGCYQKHGGELRIVNGAHSCRHSEIPISWNKLGPQGPIGPAGPEGPAGPPGSQAPQVAGEQSRVYDANGQYLGISPSTRDGFLSVFVPSLSKFILLSPETGDVDERYPAVYIYFDGDNCSGNSFLELNMRYEVHRLGSTYFIADDVAAKCEDIKSVSMPYWSEIGTWRRRCESTSSTCMNVLPYKEVKLPFSPPVVLPLVFE